MLSVIWLLFLIALRANGLRVPESPSSLHFHNKTLAAENLVRSVISDPAVEVESSDTEIDDAEVAVFKFVSTSSAVLEETKATKSIPSFIIQFGHARTATTLQFEALCASMITLNRGKVDCRSTDSPTTGSLKSEIESATAGTYMVLKTHSESAVLEMMTYMQRSFWVFATGKNAMNSIEESRNQLADGFVTTRDSEHAIDVPVEYTQLTSELKLHSYLIVFDYAQIFGLAEHQTKVMVHYMRYWSVLRQCCGPQLSSDWRAVLLGRTSKHPHHSPLDTAYPACEIYDINAVESALMDSEIFKQRRAFGIRQDYADIIPNLDGTYCSWFSHQIACQKLAFNQLPKEPYC